MATLKLRLLGMTAGNAVKALRADTSTYKSGILQAAIVEGSQEGGKVSVLNAAWRIFTSGTATSPALLTMVEVYNTTGAALTFRLAMLNEYTGSPAPTTSDAFLAWDTPIAAYSAFRWTGAAALVDRYVYIYGSGSGITAYCLKEYLDPA